jgi:translocation and assembly module TamB
LWLLIFTRTSIALGGILLVAIIAGVWYARNFINNRLGPLLESNLEQLLGRPVEIGEVERFSFNSLRFNSAAIPATPNDPDRVVAEAVEVRFDLWRLVTNRTLGLDVTLFNSDVYLEQAQNGRWVDTEIQTQAGEETDFIAIDLETIRAENADLVLVPNPEPDRPQGAVAIAQVDATARFLEQDRGIGFEVSGQPTTGGKIVVNGEYTPASEQTKLAIAGQNILAADVSRLIDLPVDLLAGRADANLKVQLQPNQEQPVIVGKASLNDVTAQIADLPQRFVNTQGKLLFRSCQISSGFKNLETQPSPPSPLPSLGEGCPLGRGEGKPGDAKRISYQNIALENFSTSYGAIPVRLDGSLNTLKGYNLSGRVQPVSVKNLLGTLNVDLPFPTAGTARADLRLQGAIDRPILTGNVSTINNATVDRLAFRNIGASFRLIPEQLTLANIRATPVVGGLVTGSGRIDLENRNQLVLNFQASNVPGNAIARTYGADPEFTIGAVAATARISGTPGNIRTVAQVRAPNAAYPGQAEVVVTNEGTTLIRDAAFQVAGGRVQGSGQIRNGEFQAVVDAANVALNQLSPDLRGQLNANLRLSGTSFDLSNIQAQGRVRFSQGIAVVERPLTAQVRWNGQQIIVQNATAPGVNASGTIGVRLEGEQAPQIAGLNLNVQANNYNLQALDLNLPEALDLAGTADFTGRVTGTANAPNAVGDIRLQNLQLNDIEFEPILTGNLNYQAEGQTELQVSGQQDRIALVLDPDNIINLDSAFALAGGRVQGSGQISNGDFQAVVNTANVALNEFSPDLRGELDASLRLSGTSFDLANIQAQGQVSFSEGIALIEEPLTAQVQWNGDRIIVQNATAPGLNASGTIGVRLEGEQAPQIAQLNLNVQADNYDLQDLGLNLPGNIALAGTTDFTGRVTGTPNAPNAVGDLQLQNLTVNNLAFEPVLTGNLNYQTGQRTALQVSGQQDRIALVLDPDNRPSSFLIRRDEAVASARTQNGNLIVNVEDFPVAVLRNAIPGDAVQNLDSIAGDVSASLVIDLGEDIADSTVVGDVAIAQPRLGGIAAEAFRANISYQDGDLTLRGGELLQGDSRVALNGNFQAGGAFQAVVDAASVPLNQFSPDLRGELTANLRLSGTSFDLSSIQAQGQVRFSEGLALIEEPLTAQVRWNGEQIIVQNATAPGLNANGTIALQLEGEQAPQIAGLNLNVQADDYNLQDLGLNLPGNIALAGTTDFTGRVTGTPNAPNAVGDIRLQNLQVNDLAFEPVLTGNLNYQAGAGAQLQVSGQQDRIALVLGPDNLPSAFSIRRDEAIASGRTENGNLIVNISDFPVAVLRNAIPGAALQNLDGNVSANLTSDLAENIAESTVFGDVAIDRPRVGTIAADEFQANIRYQDGNLTLSAGQLIQGDSRIAIDGGLQAGGEFQFQIDLASVRIERVLPALGNFGFTDVASGPQPDELAGAETLENISAGVPDASLLNQLRRFTEIQVLLAQQRRQRERETTLPPLTALNGTIGGEITVSGSLQTGIQPTFNASFELIGQDWEWGEYTIDEAIAQGTYNDGTLTLQPLRIDLDEGAIAYSGQLGQEALTGQVQVQQLPVELIEPFLPNRLPVQLDGRLNALVNLAGSLNNPSATGEIALVEGTINDRALETAQLNFTYDDARLNFDSTLGVAQTQQPVEITGSIPIALPFAAVEPDSDRISLRANVRDEGLALLNLFTDAVTWVNGQGQLNVEVGGTLNQPMVMGTVAVENATLNAQALPEPLTNVTGTARFNSDRLIVEGIQAQYSTGQVMAEGILPIFASAPAQQLAANNPLTVSLVDLDLDLNGLYEGSVSGNVVITDTVLSPDLGGAIRLSDGEVSLGGGEPTLTTETDAAIVAAQPGTPPAPSPIGFAGLQLILDENVRITNEPILSFEGEGELEINGTLDNPRPVGVVNLTGGQIDLFTTQFTLDRGYEQTATFTPEGGIDPILDINLVATVPEVTGSRVSIAPTTPFPSSEIQEVLTTGFTSVRSVRVEATVRGPASELEDNLELTSDPARSEAEIVALLGGSLVNALSAVQADPGQGLAVVGGSTLFGYLQGDFNEFFSAIGVSEFRLFPTLVTDPDDDVAVLGLSAEAVFDLTDDFSASVSYIIAADEPLRYNVIYRISDELRVRGSTNLAGESRALVEFESSF